MKNDGKEEKKKIKKEELTATSGCKKRMRHNS